MIVCRRVLVICFVCVCLAMTVFSNSHPISPSLSFPLLSVLEISNEFSPVHVSLFSSFPLLRSSFSLSSHRTDCYFKLNVSFFILLFSLSYSSHDTSNSNSVLRLIGKFPFPPVPFLLVIIIVVVDWTWTWT